MTSAGFTPAYIQPGKRDLGVGAGGNGTRAQAVEVEEETRDIPVVARNVEPVQALHLYVLSSRFHLLTLP